MRRKRDATWGIQDAMKSDKGKYEAELGRRAEWDDGV